MNLKGKTIIVTGASSGIGKSIALEFAKEGANIAISYRFDKEGAQNTLELIKKCQVKGSMYQAELSNEETVKHLVKSVNKEFKTIDILINNAGKADPKSIDQLDTDTWTKALNDNFISAVNCTKEVLKVMRKQTGKPKGKIINIASINGLGNCGRPGNIAYSSAKGALSNFTYTLAKGEAPDILITGIAPGPVITEAWEGVSKERLNNIKNDMFIKRFVKPEEIAQTAIFLARNDAMNGEIIIVDGGFNLKNYQ